MQQKNDFFGLTTLVRSVAHAVMRPKEDLSSPVAAAVGPAAGTGVVRPAIGSRPLTAAITPARMAVVIDAAAKLADTFSYFEVAEMLEEQDLHYRSLISTRKLAVAGLDIAVEPYDTSRQARQAAELVETVLCGEVAQTLLLDLLDGVSKGVSIVEIAWDTSGAQWVPSSFDWRDPRWFDFNKTDGSTVMLRGPGGVLQELPPRRFIVHKPRLKTGLPVRSGLALPGAYAWVLKNAMMTNWATFAEVYGQPFRVGKFQKGTKKEDVLGLKKALASLGSDAYAVLSSDMAVEFIDAGSKNGNVNLYDRFQQYLEEQQSKLVLGQTLTSGSGQTAGSYALGLVHNEVRQDILRSDAKQLASTLLRDLVRPLIDFNFGPAVPLPTVRLVTDEGEDLVALATVLEKTVPLGIGVSQKWARDKFGIPAPEADEPLLASATPVLPAGLSAALPALDAPAAGNASNAGNPKGPKGASGASDAAGAADPAKAINSREHVCHAQGSPRDALDDLGDAMMGDWQVASDALQAQMLKAVEGATDFLDLKERLAAFVRHGDVQAMAKLLANGRATARTVGLVNGNIGG
ncbi:Mu-like prophage protein gp29 [Burkholderia pseudomallei]|nr:Mu-like prophage protein gp29 [Burkholderia pseudomallei]